MLRIKFQDLYCHFIVILNQMVMLFLLKIGELSMIMTHANSTSKCKFTTSNLKTPQLELKN